jgi:hypothetical protein
MTCGYHPLVTIVSNDRRHIFGVVLNAEVAHIGDIIAAFMAAKRYRPGFVSGKRQMAHQWLEEPSSHTEACTEGDNFWMSLHQGFTRVNQQSFDLLSGDN